jgi:RNA polymerase sigma-70 factor, ECF subfamily
MPMEQADANRRRYEQWVRQFARPLYCYAYRLTGNGHIAEDLVQETFTEAWRSMARQNDEERARAWLFQILRFRHAHLIRDRGRRLQPMRLMDNADEQAADVARPPLEKLAEQDAIGMALNELSLPLRETFLLVFMEGCTCREAAEKLRIPLGTVLSRLDSARRVLRTALAGKPSPDKIEAAIHSRKGRAI